MANLQTHPLVRAAYDVCQLIEACGASEALTRAVSAASALLDPIETLAQERDRLAEQARDISVRLSDAGFGPCPIPEAVGQLLNERDRLRDELREAEQKRDKLRSSLGTCRDEHGKRCAELQDIVGALSDCQRECARLKAENELLTTAGMRLGVEVAVLQAGLAKLRHPATGAWARLVAEVDSQRKGETE